MNYLELGQKIRIARKRKGYTQAEVAEILGYSVQHISHVENGVTKMSIEFVVSLANCLEVSLDELFSDSLNFKGSEKTPYGVNSIMENCTKEERISLVKVLSLIKSDIEVYIELAE